MFEMKGSIRRGRPPGRWKERIKEYTCQISVAEEGKGNLLDGRMGSRSTCM